MLKAAWRPPRLGGWVRFVLSLGISWGIIMVGMAIFEKHLIFFPTRYPDGFWDTGQLGRLGGCRIEDCYFPSADGVALHGWLCTPERGDAARLLLWFHGNAGNLSHRAETMISLASRLGVRVFIVGYRGYGRSQGSPSEQGVYSDAAGAWEYLTQQQQVDPSRIVLYGISLGGAVAVELATRVEPAGLIVQSSFTSIPDMARCHYPFVPRFAIRTRMASVDKVPHLTCPKLFIHSTDDEIVPYQLGRRLYEAAAEPKRQLLLAGARHNETFAVGGEELLAAMGEFLDSLSDRS